MRTSLLALVLAAALPTVALAGGHGDDSCPHHGYGQKDRTEVPHGLKELDLTKDQLKVVAEVSEDQKQTQKDITERYLGKLSAEDKAALQKDMDANRDAREKAIRQILTPEQLKAYDEKKAASKAMHAEWEEFQKWKASKAAEAAKPAAPAAPEKK